MSATITRCTDCGAILTDQNAIMFGLCVEHVDAWFAAALAAAPATFGPTSATIATISVNGRARLAARDAAREAAHGYSVEDELREIGPEPSDEPEPVKCIRCEEMVTQYDVNQHGQPLCFPCCEDMERWDFR